VGNFGQQGVQAMIYMSIDHELGSGVQHSCLGKQRVLSDGS
jgi:hypothetical protein